MLLVQEYLRNGKDLNDLLNEHGVKSNITNGKVSLNYDQLDARDSDPLSQQCRGLILELDTWNIIACPLFRFFNMEQTGLAANIDYKSACFWEKLDGTLLIIYNYKGSWYVGTRSRCEAGAHAHRSGMTFAELTDATIQEMWQDDKNLHDLMKNQPVDYTYVFELTTPLNRIVCKYDDCRVTLLAVRNNNSLKEENPDNFLKNFPIEIKTPKKYKFSSIEDMVTVVRDMNPKYHEGLVICDANFNRIKVKNPAYIAYNHLQESLSTSLKGCIEVILTGKDDDVITMVPDFIANRIVKVKPIIAEIFNRTQKEYDSIKHIDDMKEFALNAENMLWPAALFNLKRGKTPDLRTFALGNRPDEIKTPPSALNNMVELCKKIEPKVVDF